MMEKHQQWINPLNDEEFDTAKDLIDELGQMYRRLCIKAEVIQADLNTVIEALENLVGGDIGTRQITLEGNALDVKLRGIMNASYGKERGKPHPLESLGTIHEILNSMIRTEYKESGKKIENLLRRLHEEPERLSTEEFELAKSLEQVRKFRKGKTKVEVKDKEVKEDEELR